MAYGNWGAFVYRNGERMKKWEDQTPYRENELEQGYHQAWGRQEGINPYHAVLGQQRARLCGYKNDPHFFLDGKEIDLAPYLVKEEDYEGEWNAEAVEDAPGYAFTARQYDGNMIDLELKEPDGAVWKSTCGYMYGAGHMDTED